jgi:hypothetical protein
MKEKGERNMTWTLSKQGDFASIEEAVRAAETVPPRVRNSVVEACGHFQGKNLSLSASGHTNEDGTGNVYISISASTPVAVVEEPGANAEAPAAVDQPDGGGEAVAT